jgi:hypothetical protein
LLKGEWEAKGMGGGHLVVKALGVVSEEMVVLVVEAVAMGLVGLVGLEEDYIVCS